MTTNAPPPGEVTQVVEHLFRHESAKMLSALTRVFGPEHLALAEDVVQEALIRALRTWPYYGMPKNPAAWMMQVAKNLAVDAVRRENVLRAKEPEIAALADMQEPGGQDHSDQQFSDDVLRMMFVCCHPAIPAEAQVALALKTLCGFSVGEIGRAFLTSEAAIAKRLTRARQKIRDEKIKFEVPEGDELVQRLDGVLHTLYLLFNEGYKASTGDKLVREELCFEAIRLALLLGESSAGNVPKTHAVIALMMLNAARLNSRTDAEGNLLRLKEQDRSTWDQALIARGMSHLARSAAGDDLTEYHLQSAIAACHCSAADYETTNWEQILALYDRLIEVDGRPVVGLNRAIAIAHVHGPEAGLDALAAIQQIEKLESYYLLYAVLGEFESQLDRREAAAGHFRKSLELTDIKSEQNFLAAKIRECEA